jgi:hypothetical protein
VPLSAAAAELLAARSHYAPDRTQCALYHAPCLAWEWIVEHTLDLPQLLAARQVLAAPRATGPSIGADVDSLLPGEIQPPRRFNYTPTSRHALALSANMLTLTGPQPNPTQTPKPPNPQTPDSEFAAAFAAALIPALVSRCDAGGQQLLARLLGFPGPSEMLEGRYGEAVGAVMALGAQPQYSSEAAKVLGDVAFTAFVPPERQVGPGAGSSWVRF